MDVELLREALEGACLDEMRGDPPGPLLASRLKRACGDELRRRGVSGAMVSARSDRSGTAVMVRLPPGVVRATQIVLQLGPEW